MASPAAAPRHNYRIVATLAADDLVGRAEAIDGVLLVHAQDVGARGCDVQLRLLASLNRGRAAGSRREGWRRAENRLTGGRERSGGTRSAPRRLRASTALLRGKAERLSVALPGEPLASHGRGTDRQPELPRNGPVVRQAARGIAYTLLPFR